jgi:hypothetical protein
MGTANRGQSQARTAAHAKLVVAWPDGNEFVPGTRTSGSGFGYRKGGRSRGIAARNPYEERSATTAATTTVSRIAGRRQTTARTAATAIQTSPCVPA